MYYVINLMLFIIYYTTFHKITNAVKMKHFLYSSENKKYSAPDDVAFPVGRHFSSVSTAENLICKLTYVICSINLNTEK